MHRTAWKDAGLQQDLLAGRGGVRGEFGCYAVIRFGGSLRVQNIGSVRICGAPESPCRLWPAAWLLRMRSPTGALHASATQICTYLADSFRALLAVIFVV